jgi:RimJ/RimL family protein N-acetyltransferase
MNDVEFPRFEAGDADALAGFLAGEEWPYHVRTHLDRDTVLRQVADGYYDNEGTRTFWIRVDGSAVGVVRLFDLDDGTPLFDLRLRAAERGRGIGVRAVRWLTGYVFTEFPAVDRIEGTTRQDNHAMRAVFRRCGYAKEAHYRKAWPAKDRAPYDSVGYAVLREDWATGTVTPPDFDDEPA